MKKLLLISFVMILISCTNTDRDVSQERKDSLDAAAAADSMLKDAAKEDTAAVDKVGVDTTNETGDL